MSYSGAVFLGLNINWDIVLFSALVANVIFLSSSSFLLLVIFGHATNLIVLKLK